MFRSLRSFFRRFQSSTPANYARRRLFSEQQELAKDIRQAFRAYERRLAYLEHRLLRHSDDELKRDERVFEASHKALMQVLQRLRAADADAEQLVREWQDWQRAHHDVSSEEQRSRLELLRSELSIRGILPSAPEKSVSVSAATRPTKKKTVYTPTRLSDDALRAFDEVYHGRLSGSRTQAERLASKLFHRSGHPLKNHLVAKQVKRLHELQKRWRKAL